MRPQPRPSELVLPATVVAAALRAPLYRSLVGDEAPGTDLAGWPTHDHGDLLGTGDPFGGRRDPSSPPVTITQACDDAPVYWTLAPDELSTMARVLAGCWRALGLGRGDRVGIYDYGSSPVTRYASRYFHAYLDAGAAELTGCVPICNDGLAELADRAAHLVEYVHPDVLFVAAHVTTPLLAALGRRRDDPPVALVLSADEEPWRSDALVGLLSARVTTATQVLRSDLALLLAPPCRVDPATFHPDPAVYTVEILDEATGRVVHEPGSRGALVVTNRALRTSPVIRYVTDVRVVLGRRDCTCDGAAVTVQVAA